MIGLDALGLALIISNVSILTTWRLWISEHTLDLFHLIFRSWLHVIYPYMQKMGNIKMCNAWGAKCNMIHDYEHLNHINPYNLFTKLPLEFLLI
jgi:hypothetical protein